MTSAVLSGADNFNSGPRLSSRSKARLNTAKPAVAAQTLERSVHVHCRQAGHIRMRRAVIWGTPVAF